MDLNKLHFEIKNDCLISKRKFNEKLLSKSDVSILNQWINNIKKINHQEIFKLYKNENSWLKTKFNDLVLFEDIIENSEVLNDLKDCNPFSIVI